MNEDQIYNFNWEDFGITTTNPQGTTTLTYYNPSNNLFTLKTDYSYGHTAISWQDKVNGDIKQMKRHMSDMQTEINNLRAENQLLRNSLKDFVNEMKKIILKKEKNNE